MPGGFTPPPFNDGDPREPVTAEKLGATGRPGAFDGLGGQYEAVRRDLTDPDSPVGEALAEAVPPVTDGSTAELITTPGTLTGAALNAAFAGAGVPVTAFGASPTATAAQNVTAFRAAVAWCRTNSFGIRTLYIPPVEADEQYELNDDITVTGDVTVLGAGRLSRIKQTVKTKAIFRACDKGQRYAHFHVIGADDRDTIPDGGGEDLIRDQHPFANHVGVAFQYGSDGGIAEHITGEDINVVVGCWGWDDTADDYVANIQGLTVENIHGEDVWCVFFAREVDNLVYGKISGTYKRLPLIFADPHLIYLTSSNYVSSFRPLYNPRGSGFIAYDSVGGEPIAVKDVIGGSIDGIVVRGTPGIAIFAEVDGLTIGPYIADDIWKDPATVGTPNSSSGGQAGMLTFSACKNVTLVPGSRQRNRTGDQAKSIVFASASTTIAECENIEIAVPWIETNHATTDTADNRAEVYCYGKNVRLVFTAGSKINMLGGHRHGIRMAGTSPSVVAPNISGCLQAVITNGTGITEVQTVTINGGPTGGTFTLTYSGQTTSALAYNATAADVQAALRALSTIGGSNVNVTGGPGPGTPYTVTFAGTMVTMDAATITATSSLTGGTSPGVTVAVALAGIAGAAKVYDYDPGRIVTSDTSLTPIRLNASTDTLMEVLTNGSRALAFDRGLVASPSGRLIALSSGQKPTLYGAVFEVHSGKWNCISASATLPRYAAFDIGSADVDVESYVWLGVIDSGGSGTYSVGHVLRAVSEYTNLLVELRIDRLTVTYRSGASGLNLTSVASVLGAYKVGKRYTLRSVVFGDSVQVFVDGVKIIDATLDSGQMSALGTATLHGITERQSLASKWANFRLDTLAA